MSVVLCISGHDPSGGAGIAADARACDRSGVEFRGVITAITAQSHEEFLGVRAVSQRLISQQLKTALTDGADAVKVGLVYSPKTARLLGKKLAGTESPVVLDPVMYSSSGGDMAQPGLIKAMKEEILPLVDLICPNRKEAELICGRRIPDPGAAQEACIRMHEMGAGSVLLKGGHFSGPRASDLLFNGDEFHEISSKRLPGDYRGTGCVYSTLIAAKLSEGTELTEAVKASKNILYNAIEYTSSHGQGRALEFGPTESFG